MSAAGRIDRSSDAARRRASLAGRRVAAQLLNRPRRGYSPAELAAAVGGVQAQDPVAARLGFRARDSRLTAAEVNAARNEERSLIRTWVMRDTVHLLAAEDAWWMLPLFEPRLAAKSRARLGALGLTDREVDRALSAIRRALADGPIRRVTAVEAVARAGIEMDDHRNRNIVHNATVAGICVQGPDDGAQQTLVERREWLPEPTAKFDRQAALCELTLRYLRAFAPATEADIAGFTGLGLADVRTGLKAVADNVVSESIGDQPAWRLKARAPRAAAGVVRLIPAFDNYLMGHRDRDFIAAGDEWRAVMPGGGILRPTILRDGQAIGTWSIKRSGARAKVAIKPFARLDKTTLDAIETEIADIGRFEGLEARLSQSQ